MNKHPEFFNTIEPIVVQDELAAFLGAFEDGIYEISYLDVVKNAGHSCPTVAGAYLMCQKGLEVLYDGKPVQRGTIHVTFAQNQLEGVTGVIANVVSHITGATKETGFKGIGGNFVRHSLMEFEQNIGASIRFKRQGTGASVLVSYDPSSIKPDPNQIKLMQKISSANATTQEKQEFAKLWQDRVQRIFNNSDAVLHVTKE